MFNYSAECKRDFITLCGGNKDTPAAVGRYVALALLAKQGILSRSCRGKM